MNDNKDSFVDTVSVIGEPARAKMLYSLLTTGKALTANELAMEADVSVTSASNHLSKLVNAKLLKVEKQGRHRYFAIYDSYVAHAIEAMLHIVKTDNIEAQTKAVGIKYCRTCYDHLAGWVGASITKRLEELGILQMGENEFVLTDKGYAWMEDQLGIMPDKLKAKKRLFAGRCLDWSERKIHVSGQVGALILTVMLEKGWVRKIDFTREISVTNIGKIEINRLLGIAL